MPGRGMRLASKCNSNVRCIYITLLLTGCTEVFSQASQSSDFTAEHLFTNNIEGPCFHKGTLYVVNYQHDGTIGAIGADGSVALFVTLPAGSTANAIQFDKAGNMLLADFTGHTILKVDMQSKAISIFAYDNRFNQPNDICINKKGQLFASDPNWKESTGQLWRIEPNGKTILLRKNMGTTNGITLSPDEKILYVNESVQRKIWAFDVDKNGDVSNQRLFALFDDFGLDGMKCDEQGNLYVTRHGKGTVVMFSSDGKQLREISLKGKKPSNLTFSSKEKIGCYITMQDRGCIEVW
ncbi:MAG: SMP-30/gluconolactonase/LRE family protein, partial [Flammeovirgaceae bacterium]